MWLSFLIVGTLFPPALLWAVLSPQQTAGARALIVLALIVVTAFGYVVWILLLIRMGDMQAADRQEASHRRERGSST